MNKIKIGTHNEVFHVDECLACYILTQLPEYKDVEIIRTRDINVLNECDILVDIGAVYDHDKKIYNHHQREFNETFEKNYKTKLSSA